MSEMESRSEVRLRLFYSIGGNKVRYNRAATPAPINRRWGFGALGMEPLSETITQLDTRLTYELVSSSFKSNNTEPRVIPHTENRMSTVFIRRGDHPFHVDQEYDYYPTSRISHNYVRIENDPVNMMADTAPTDEEGGFAEAARIIGSIREGYHRRVEHIGGTPRVETIYDIANSGWSGKFPKFPPQPGDFDDPDRYFLRTTDMGYVHYIKSSYHATNNEALETRNVTGSKEFIWNQTDMVRGATLPGDNLDNEAVKIKDIVTLENAALADVHTNLNNIWLAEDQVWERFHLPGRAKIKLTATTVEITQYDADYSTVHNQILMTKDGSLVIEGDGATITMSGGTVDIT